MQPSEPTYDIHEKIAQLETELLQHELLIRRQKHVINSLKTMITADHIQSPPRTMANSSTSTVNQRASSSSSSVARAPNGGARTPAVPSAGVAIAAAAQTKRTPATAVVRPINMQKKRTAMAKVAQFCKTIPKFGDDVPPKRRKSTSNREESGEPPASSKRQRAQDGAAVVQSPQQPSQPASRTGVQTSGPTATSSSQRTSSASRHSQHSHHTVRDSDEDENDQADEEAFLAAASAKLNYLNAVRSSTSSTSNASHQYGSTSTSTLIRPSRPAMVAVQLPPPTTSSQANRVVSNGSSGGSAVRTTNTVSTSSQGALNRTNSAVRTSTETAARPVTSTATTSSTSSSSKPTRPVSTVSSTTTPASTTTTSSNSSTSRAHAHILTTPVQSSSSQGALLASPITSPRNLLTGTTHKNLAIFEYCKNVRSLDDKLEVAKDMHSNIQNNPRRLQQFLDSTGGRDLFLSWLTECMERMEGGALRPDEELARTKLMEYTVLLINQAFWNAKSVSELKFDKTLKNLYRLFENRKEPHHVTVANIVKAIWPSYRIMRKEHESKSAGKNKNVFVVD